MASPFYELPDLARLGVAPKPGLLKYRRPFEHDFEPASTRRDQIDRRRWVTLAELSRQTGSSGLVVSNGTIFDLDVHGGHSVGALTRPTEISNANHEPFCGQAMTSETLR